MEKETANQIAARWAVLTVTDEVSARDFLTDVVGVLGKGFHPDTDFSDYVNFESGERVFTDAQSALLTVHLIEAAEWVDTYAVTLDLFKDLGRSANFVDFNVPVVCTVTVTDGAVTGVVFMPLASDPGYFGDGPTVVNSGLGADVVAAAKVLDESTWAPLMGLPDDVVWLA